MTTETLPIQNVGSYTITAWEKRTAFATANGYGFDPGMYWEGMEYDERLQACFNSFQDETVVEVEVNDGEIWIYTHRRLTEADAAKLVEKVDAAREINPTYWRHERTMYGSEAYVRNDVDGQLAALEYDAERGGHGYRSSEDYFNANLFKCM